MFIRNEKNPATKTRNNSFDRRQLNRNCVQDAALSCRYQGRQVELQTIELTAQGARVLAPRELLRSGRLVLVYSLPRMEVTMEYRVVWAQPVAGNKAIAGLHCLSSSDRRAA